MTPEEKKLLLHSVKLAEDNNRLLRGLRRSARISSLLTIIYWLIVIGAVFGAYYTIQPRLQPYIDSIVSNYNGMKETVDEIKSYTNRLPVSTTSSTTKK